MYKARANTLLLAERESNQTPSAQDYSTLSQGVPIKSRDFYTTCIAVRVKGNDEISEKSDFFRDTLYSPTSGPDPEGSPLPNPPLQSGGSFL